MIVGRSLLAFAGLGLLMACGKKDASDEGDVTPVVTVETAQVTSAAFTPTIRAVGTVVSSPAGYAELSAPVASRISRVLVTGGEAVQSGQVLIELDATSTRAAASGAAAALIAAQSAYDRASRLAKQGILPRKAVDQAASDLAQANAAAVGARHTYALSTLRSPISGVVTKMNAITGASADPAQVLVAIADPKALQVILQLSPSDAGSVRTGAGVVLAENDAPPGTPVAQGTVIAVGVAIDSATRAVPVRIRVGSSARPLRFGETLTGTISLTGSATALSIPAAALVPDSTGFKVYVVKGGRAYSTQVEIGTRGDSLVQIIKGLIAGQTVVTTGAYGIEDSSKVIVSKR